MLHKAVVILAVASLGSCFEVEIGRDSNVYPLFLNPFDVTHWKCLGYTVYVGNKGFMFKHLCFVFQL